MAEMLVQYENGSTFVEVLVDENRYERRDVELGLVRRYHGGNHLSGVSAEDAIKVWNQPQY